MKKQTTKGYKVTNSDLKCRNYQFELKKVHIQDGELILCENGFHFCPELNDCFDYYGFDPNNRVFEILAYGNLITNGDKCCVNEIKLVKELSWIEVLNLVNTGKGNNGRMNAGNRNAGYSNAGNDNAGAFNNLEKPAYILFNKPSSWTYDDFINSDAYRYLSQVNTTIWVPSYNMTNKGKTDFPYYITTSGFNRVLPYKEAFANSWNNWDENARKSFKALPNFDPAIFEDITGISV